MCILINQIRLRLTRHKYRRRRVFLYSSLILLLLVTWLVTQLVSQTLIYKQNMNIAHLMLEDGFAGTSVCGKFSCFGESLCKSKIKSNKIDHVVLNMSDAKIVKSWYSVNGVIVDQHRKRKNVTFKIAMSGFCSSSSCNVHLMEDIFSRTNYRDRICKAFNKGKRCNVTKVFNSWTRMTTILNSRGRLDADLIRGLSPPLTCATARLADRLVRRVIDARHVGSMSLRDYTQQEKARLLFVAKLSPGTMVQALFPPVEGWLFERSYGACGNVVVHGRAVIKTLYEMYHEPWDIRLDLAIQLLTMAHHYTDNDSKFMFLFHKLTVHDIGVSETGKLRVKNSDDIMIVDRSDIRNRRVQNNEDVEELEVKYRKHTIEVDETNFCNYERNDVNYYVTCRYFLGGTWTGPSGEKLEGGLFHDAKELSRALNRMYVLLDICSRGSAAIPPDRREWAKSVRRIAASKLRDVLLPRQKCDSRFVYRYPECELMDQSHAMYKVPEFELKWLF